MKSISSYYHHIDNGGLSIDLYDSQPEEKDTLFAWLKFSEGFFGYATGSITIHNEIGPKQLREMGEFFINAARDLENYVVENKTPDVVESLKLRSK